MKIPYKRCWRKNLSEIFYYSDTQLAGILMAFTAGLINPIVLHMLGSECPMWILLLGTFSGSYLLLSIVMQSLRHRKRAYLYNIAQLVGVTIIITKTFGIFIPIFGQLIAFCYLKWRINRELLHRTSVRKRRKRHG